ncbi:uncharacterized protein [Typha latifolia]|uniref:uncharacterized protein n=1 Tax=Typha latifolia TaxID=4733 RepID=UPI003C2BA2E8
MACINLLNPDHQHLCGEPPPMGPRISFSNDFVLEPGPPQPLSRGTTDPDFEFAVDNHQMMDADQLFFNGRILPLKNGHRCGPPKGAIKWRELLGIKKGNASAAKTGGQSDDGPPETAAAAQVKKPTQEFR